MTENNHTQNKRDYFYNLLVNKLEEHGINTSSLNPGMSSDSLIDFLKENVDWPSYEHYEFIQYVWWRDCAYLTHNGDPAKVVMYWVNNQEIQHHDEYCGKYIEPAFIKRNLNSKQIEFSEGFIKRNCEEHLHPKKFNLKSLTL